MEIYSKDSQLTETVSKMEKKKKLTFRNLEIILQEQHMSVRNIISQ